MAAPGENLKIDADRLWDSLMEMAKIGPGVAGGNNRQTLTDEDGEGRALFQRWCEAAGCEIGLDQMGNMFAMRAGTDPEALPVYVGSHLDTQPTGGKYDGVLGVLGGLEVVRTLNDLGIRTKHPIVVTNWTNEEGTRFAPAMLASGVFAGVHTQDWAYGRTDAKGSERRNRVRRLGQLLQPLLTSLLLQILSGVLAALDQLSWCELPQNLDGRLDVAAAHLAVRGPLHGLFPDPALEVRRHAHQQPGLPFIGGCYGRNTLEVVHDPGSGDELPSTASPDSHGRGFR